ncbi:hypothetical protein SOVF_152590 [Spinacia oleracea]|uniref:Trihelix transcription factor ENAP1 n=1 Tax=Spinacia oleracea TaxID=3562 RepID=A0A9R0I2Y8_SPIOL|nr:trihelix transcription factor ENAP1-like [Spinacia oleracea]KNA09549.1 hypothetical protein SOVF_152590 [Spinacia oleracea]
MGTPKQSGGRDDCWNEESTGVLIEAWGERYLRSNRGNLRQNDWNDVADAVNSAGVIRRRTDIQCKNRIDTIKKKYKVEKARSPPSTWRFFQRLDFLIGNVNVVKVSDTKNASPSPNPNPNPNSRLSLNSSNSSESTQSNEGGAAVEMEVDVEERDRETAVRELARAVVKFGEVYERIESWKQEKVMELEKQRMELAKELEFQRMNMFVDAQIQLEKFKHSNKKSASRGKKL